MDDDTVYHINPSGSFILGGPCVSLSSCHLETSHHTNDFLTF